jgi:hypothetical protein
MPEELLDIPIETEVIDTPAEETQVDDTPLEAPDDATPEPIAAADEEIDWRKVPANLREFFKTPEGKHAKEAWFERSAFKELFPNIDEAKSLQAFLDEQGGRDGVTRTLGELKTQAEQLTSLQTTLQRDPSAVIPQIAEANPNAIPAMAPQFMQQWAKSDPEGWNRQMSATFAATINQPVTADGLNIPTILNNMQMQLQYGDTASLTQSIAAVKTWLQSFGQIASAPAQPRQTTQTNELSQREQALNEREESAFIGDFKGQAESWRGTEISKELKSYFDRDPKDTEKRDLALRTVTADVKERMKADKDFQDKLNGFTSRRDAEGALRLLKSREAIAIKDIAPKVGRLMYGQAAAKPAPKSDATTPKPVAKSNSNGYVRPKDRFEEIWAR